MFFGALPLQMAKADYERRLKTWEEWQPVAESRRAERSGYAPPGGPQGQAA